MLVFSVRNTVVWNSYLTWLIGESLARARMRCVKTFDNFWFQNVLSNGGDDSENETGQSTNNLSRIYVGAI